MRVSLIAAALLATAGLVPMSMAQDTQTKKAEKAAPTLAVGQPAPEFKVEKFLKGKPITSLEKGHVYVVEFWATWCGPCIMSMPHISELQSEYKDKGVTICGVNIWEDKEYNDATLEKAVKFVENKGDGMAYTVAYDGADKFMDTNWMRAAGRNGIPSAFVVDKAGKIAWMGHPMELDMVLDGVVKGTWDAVEGPKQIKAASTAFDDAGAKYKDGVAAGDAAWAAAVKQYPAMERSHSMDRFGAMLSAGHTSEALTLGNTLLEKSVKAHKDGPIMELMSAMGDPSMLESKEAKQFLLKAAKANFEMADKSQSSPHIVLARAYFVNGEMEKGREAAKKAVELADEKQRTRMESYLKDLEDNSGK